MELTAAQVDDLCLRSSRGERVRDILAEWGCDDSETLESLKRHHFKLQNAKCSFLGEKPKHLQPEHQLRVAKADR